MAVKLCPNILIMKYCVCLSVLLLMIATEIVAQTPPQLIPPSPTAYSLGKYGDIPVNYYTGVPDISIPIHSLKERDVAVDITLSYHGSGIKVDEQASFVGLGWSLNAGGVITRTIRGRAESLNSAGVMIPTRTNIAFYDIYTYPDVADHITNNNLYAAASDITDNGPDDYFFNFNGRSGKFIFDNNGNALLEKQEGLDIHWEYVAPDIQKFIIKDETGTIYEFSDYETTYYGGNDGLKISSWYLSKITTPTNNVINFEYYAGASSDNYSRAYSSTILQVTPAYADITPPINAVYYSTFGMSEIRLRRISSTAGAVELKYKSTNRLDYIQRSITNVAWSALDSIIVSGMDGTVLKRTKLSTSYFEADNINKYSGLNPQDFQFLNYRLRLDAVQHFNSQGAPIEPPYSFSYLGDNDPATFDVYTLPYRLSPAQDHWGYFNRAPNTHLFPGNPDARAITNDMWLTMLHPSGSDFDPIYRSLTGGANREPDTAATKACMLYTVTYPTGGQTVYDFETNNDANFGGARIKSIKSIPITGGPIETNYEYSGHLGFDPRDFYYKLYTVDYQFDNIGYQPQVPAELLQVLGVPVNHSYTTNPVKYVKVTATPQALLGMGSQLGYYSVSASQTGNGKTVYNYLSSSSYPDLTEHLGLEPSEYMILDNMFNSEYVRGYAAQQPTNQYYTTYLTFKDWPYPEKYSNSWKRGTLSSKIVVGENGAVKKEEQFYYHRKLLSAIPGYTVAQIRSSEFVYTKYYVPHAWAYLDSTTVKEYDQNGQNPLISATKYYYDNTNHLQPTRVERIKSNGIKETVLTTYPLDYAPGTPFVDNMTSRHLLGYPIEKIVFHETGIGKQIVSGLITTYKNDGSGLKDQEQVLEIAGPLEIASFKMSNRNAGVLPPLGSPSSFTADARYNTWLTFDGYDAKGNVQQVTGKDGVVATYIWGYNQHYPVAKVAGKPYNDVVSQSGVNLSLVNDLTVDDAAMRAELGKLRYMPGNFLAMTYTYKPSIGMSSETDPTGKTIYYEYDHKNRLKIIRDQHLKVLKQFDYQYAPPSHNNPVWVALSNRCVKDVNGDNTGVEEQQQQDVNPNSPTYEQTQWISLGQTGACPTPIYAVLYYDDCWSDGMDEYCELVISFYADAGMTTPVSVNGLTVNVRLDEYNNGQQSTSHISFSCYGSESRHGGWRVTGDGYTATHSLEAGEGYKY